MDLEGSVGDLWVVSKFFSYEIAQVGLDMDSSKHFFRVWVGIRVHVQGKGYFPSRTRRRSPRTLPSSPSSSPSCSRTLPVKCVIQITHTFLNSEEVGEEGAEEAVGGGHSTRRVPVPAGEGVDAMGKARALVRVCCLRRARLGRQLLSLQALKRNLGSIFAV